MEKLVELVNVWAQYARENPDMDIRGFCVKYLTDEEASDTLSRQENAWLDPANLDARLGKAIGKLSKYSNFYAKKAMAELPLSNIDELIYLGQLQYMGQPKKSELIYEMISEFPSGIEIIKRLAGMGLLEEFPDEHDKRSKRLRITPRGMEVLVQCFPRLHQVGHLAFGSLNKLEKNLLVRLLERLDAYHTERYKAARNADFETVVRMLAE